MEISQETIDEVRRVSEWAAEQEKYKNTQPTDCNHYYICKYANDRMCPFECSYFCSVNK
jgi:hypothetical protein